MADDNRAAYLDGIKMLSRRELSEAQVRQRLARREHAADAIDHAVGRLREERALDDRRVAEAIARMETGIRRRGRIRVRLQLARAGIDKATARAAIDEVFGALDDDALLEASLNKRLRGRSQIEDDREFQRLFRYLIGQGFEAERVSARLRTLRRKHPGLE
jgi:regulatory protein